MVLCLCPGKCNLDLAVFMPLTSQRELSGCLFSLYSSLPFSAMPPGPVLSFIEPASSLLNKLQRDDPLSCLADADLETHSQDLPLTSKNYIINQQLVTYCAGALLNN